MWVPNFKSKVCGGSVLLLVWLMIGFGPLAGTARALSLGGVLDKAQKAVRVGQAFHKASQDFTPEQEYYIGRAVAASILSTYPPHNDPTLNAYLNWIGRSLARASDKPETFGGYHFLAMETQEVNAFACPGGLILVSQGLIDLCHNEDELAAVLAHEIGHVQLDHGLKAIKQGRMTDAAGLLAAEAAGELTPGGMGQLVGLFNESIGDVVKKMVVNGYSREQELEADYAALTILDRVGYHPRNLVAVLEGMRARFTEKSAGFAKTHPDPKDRIAEVEGYLPPEPAPGPPPARQDRFRKALVSKK